jgi:hypothetical protein
VIIFEQGVLPCLTNEGKIIMEDKHKVPHLSLSLCVCVHERRELMFRLPLHQMVMGDYT